MALRRPRVKACANLSSKRKIKKEGDETNQQVNTNASNTIKVEPKDENKQKPIKVESSQSKKPENQLETSDIPKIQEPKNEAKCVKEEKEKKINALKLNLEIKNTPADTDDTKKCSRLQPTTTLEATNSSHPKVDVDFKSTQSHPTNEKSQNPSDTSIVNVLSSPPHHTNSEYSNTLEAPNFKCPPNVEKKEKINLTNSSVITDIGQYTDSSSQQQHQQNLSNSSPIKHRQRIRPMPFFGLRRNSIQGSNTDSEDESRRYHKLNTPTALHSPMISDYNRMNAFNYNRKRTESTCSNMSESGRTDRPRKVYVTEESQRIATAKKEFNMKFDGGVPDKSVLKMFDFIYYNPLTNPMKQVQKTTTEDDTKSTSDEQQANVDNSEKEKSEKSQEIATENPEAPPSSIPVPQLKLGANGELVLDETSLVIETTAEKEAREKLANTSVIYVDENTENNGFYKRQKRTRDWNAEETIKFYRCLHTVGTDFSLMLTLFPNRSRRDLKLKFKKEEKQNLALINKALLYPKTFDIEELKLELEKDEEEAAEKSKQWEEIKRKNQLRKKAIKTKSAKKSKAGRALNHGDLVYENENAVDAKVKPKKESFINKVTEYHIHDASGDTFEVTTLDDGDFEVNEEEYRETEQKLFDALLDTEGDFHDDANDDYLDTSTLDSCSQIEIVKSDLGNDDIVVNQVEMNDSTKQMKTESKSAKLEHKLFSNVHNVLREIANGSLVAVSSEDPDDPEKIIHEIYVVCKDSGELSDEPLDLPEEVMQCIISAMSL